MEKETSPLMGVVLGMLVLLSIGLVIAGHKQGDYNTAHPTATAVREATPNASATAAAAAASDAIQKPVAAG